jgi:hypothetical protein
MEIIETVEVKKVKKPRSDKQIAATKLLVERNRLKREAKKTESEKLPDLPAEKPLVIKEVIPEVVPEVKVKKVRKPRVKKVKPPTPPPPSSDSETESDEELTDFVNKIDINPEPEPYIEIDEPPATLPPIEPPKPRIVKLPRRYR